ncbi:MAG: hypothetical protein ABIV05_05865 [Actinomycetota bacterium]
MSYPPAPPAPPARRRLPTWAKWLIGVTVVVVVIPLALLAALAWSFSGGWDGIRPQPQAGDRRVVRARERAAAPLDRLTASTLPVVGGAELVRARTDECREGQNNWKIHDGYKLRCELTDVVVRTASEADVSTVAARVDAALRASGRQPTYDGSGLDQQVYGGQAHGSYVGTTGDVSVVVLLGGAGGDDRWRATGREWWPATRTRCGPR